jgi:hypothetical protein
MVKLSPAPDSCSCVKHGSQSKVRLLPSGGNRMELKQYHPRMSTLVAVATATSTSSASRISFATEGGGSWPAWDRFITLDGKKAYHIGNVCGTCEFFFERLEGANDKVSPAELSQIFRTGITQLDEDLLRTVATALPSGLYSALLLECVPRRVLPLESGDYFREEQVALWGINGFWGLPHYTKTEYYRTGHVTMPEGKGLFEFIVPMFPKTFLHGDAVSLYRTALEAGTTPTALALSVLDVKQPADWEGDPEINAHWCLSHYLLDGHHKTFAASELGLPISILSFLAVERGVSTRDQIAEVIEVLAAQSRHS